MRWPDTDRRCAGLAGGGRPTGSAPWARGRDQSDASQAPDRLPHQVATRPGVGGLVTVTAFLTEVATVQAEEATRTVTKRTHRRIRFSCRSIAPKKEQCWTKLSSFWIPQPASQSLKSLCLDRSIVDTARQMDRLRSREGGNFLFQVQYLGK